MDCQGAARLLSGAWKFKPLENRTVSGTQEPEDPQNMNLHFEITSNSDFSGSKVHEILSLNEHISENFYNSHLSCFCNRLRNKFIKPCEVPASKQRRFTEVIARTSTVCHTFNLQVPPLHITANFPCCHWNSRSYCLVFCTSMRVCTSPAKKSPSSGWEMRPQAIPDPVVERVWSRADPSTALPNLCETLNCSWLGLCSRAAPHE